MADESQVKVSYYLKNPVTCPVCKTLFYKEEMLSGGGRLIAKTITDELRRVYEPSKKVGEIHPLIYPVTVCPECLYAAYAEDFPHLRIEHVPIAFSQRVMRKEEIAAIFPVMSFKEPRSLSSGAASYILSIGSYSFHPKERAPTFKKALSSLRAAWIFDDLDKKHPGQNYDRIKVLLYRKTIDYYERSINFAQNGQERIDSVKNFGPDLDKNYGFQGVLFMFTRLLYKYGDDSNKKTRIAKLQSSRRIISRVFGTGKSSKTKPSFILELAKELYEEIGVKIDEIIG
jgi:hypothetical protein